MVDSHSALRAPDELGHREFELVVRRLADDLAYGSDSSLFVGSGIEYAQSRPYVPGDPIRQMDWRVSARTGKLHLKEYEALKRMAAYLVVDTSASMDAASGRLTKHDVAVWLAAALGLVALRRLSPVAVLSGGQRDVRSVPSLLRSDLWQALEPMRHQVPGEKTGIGVRLRRISASAARHSLIFVFSDLHDPDAVPAIQHAAQRHDCLVLQLQDPAERGALRAGFLRAAEAETGHEFIATGRSKWFDDAERGAGPELSQGGVDHLMIPVDQPFVTRLRHFLTTRGTIGRG